MATLLDYLHWRGDITLDIAPFCAADDLVMARIAYIPFEDVVEFNDPITVGEACRKLLLKEDGSVQLIRRAEEPKDYFATFDGLDIWNKFQF